MAEMSGSEIMSAIDSMLVDAYDDALISDSEYNYDRYNMQPLGNEKPLRSKVVAEDGYQVVESYMTSLSRVFLGANQPIEFSPANGTPEASKEAAEKTDYIDYLVRGQEDSYIKIESLLREPLISKFVAAKYYVEEAIKTERIERTGLSEDELAATIESMESEESVQSVDMVARVSEDSFEAGIEFEITRKVFEYKLRSVPMESFRITLDAESIEDAELVGDEQLFRRGELVGMGYSKDIVDQLLSCNEKGERLEQARDRSRADNDDNYYSSEWSNQKVLIKDTYPLLDPKCNGKLERYHVMYGDGLDEPLEFELFERPPYAVGSAIGVNFRVIGKSVMDSLKQTISSKTALSRAMHDNAFAAVSPRFGITSKVNIDDVMNWRPNAPIRTKETNQVGNEILPVVIPFMGDKTLQLIQYCDAQRVQTAGALLPSQGLNADDLNSETATRFNGVRDQQAAKVEMVARRYAETIFRQIYQGFAWMVENFQNAKAEINYMGKELSVDPQSWKFPTGTAKVKVGLGSTDDQQALRNQSELLGVKLQLKQQGSALVDDVSLYNSLAALSRAVGEQDASMHFNDPNVPDQLIKAENELLKSQMQQMTVALQQAQNPLQKAEETRAQATLLKAQTDNQTKIVEAQAKAQQEMLKLRQNQEQFQMKMAADMQQFIATINANKQKHDSDTALKLTELDMKEGDNKGADAGKTFEQSDSVVDE